MTAPAPVAVWAPNPGPQSLLVSCPVWDVLYGGARGGGKTDGLLGSAGMRSLYVALHRGTTAPCGAKLLPAAHYRGLFIRRTYDELDEAVGRSHEIFGPLGAAWRASRYTWTFPWGGYLKMRYLAHDRDAARYQGHSYNDLLVDEAGNFPSPDPIGKLRATLRDRNGVPVRVRMSANPGGPGHSWLKADYVTPAPPFTPHLDPNTGLPRVYIPSRLEDNPALVANDPTYATRLRGSGPAWLVQAWLNGDWDVAPEGGIIKLAWFRRYALGQAPVAPERYMVVQSWDTAYKPGQHNDPSVCTTWAVTTTGYYLLDVFRERLTYPALKAKAVELARAWGADAILVEDKASGQSLIQDLQASTTLSVIPVEPEGDKVTRALAVTGAMEAGRVHLPATAPWLLDFELELSMFPTKGVHDDQVDSVTQFLRWAAVHAVRASEAFSSGVLNVGAALDAGETAANGRRATGAVGWGTVSSVNDSAGYL